MKNLLLILCMGALLSSCITDKKAYRRVAEDATVNASEQEIIRNKYRGLFPEIILPPIPGGVGVDSSDYLTAIDNQNLLLDQLIKAQGLIDSITGRPPCDISAGDSARLIKNFLRDYRPKPVYIHDTTQVPVISSDAQATMSAQQNRIAGLIAENAALLAKADTAEQNAKDTKKNKWLWILGGVIALIVSFFAGKIIR
jgi:hypothetical protein